MATTNLEEETTAPYFGKGETTICPNCKENPSESGRRVQYIVVNGNFTFSANPSYPNEKNRKLYAESIRSFFIAAIWHYTKLTEMNDAMPEHQREDIRIVGWKLPTKPMWLPYPTDYPSGSSGKKEIESWSSRIDSAIAPIQSLNDLVRALKSPAISAVHYFSHGEERSISFKKDYKSQKQKSKICAMNYRDFLLMTFPENSQTMPNSSFTLAGQGDGTLPVLMMHLFLARTPKRPRKNAFVLRRSVTIECRVLRQPSPRFSGFRLTDPLFRSK